MHVTTPKIQAYYQYYESMVNGSQPGMDVGSVCENWVEWRGKGFCDSASLKADMESSLESGTDR